VPFRCAKDERTETIIERNVVQNDVIRNVINMEVVHDVIGNVIRMESKVEFMDNIIENKFKQQQATHSMEPYKECSPLDLTERMLNFLFQKQIIIKTSLVFGSKKVIIKVSLSFVPKPNNHYVLSFFIQQRLCSEKLTNKLVGHDLLSLVSHKCCYKQSAFQKNMWLNKMFFQRFQNVGLFFLIADCCITPLTANRLRLTRKTNIHKVMLMFVSMTKSSLRFLWFLVQTTNN